MNEGFQTEPSYPQRDLALILEEWSKVKLTSEAETAQALYARGQAAREFTEAVRRQWGDAAGATEWPFTKADVAGLVAAAAADGSMTYTDHFLGAVIRSPARSESVRLVREGRKWMLTMDNCMSKGRTDPAILRTTSVLRSATKAVADGVYASADEAREAMRAALAGSGVQPSSRRSAR